MIRLKIKEIAEAQGFNQSSLARESGLGFSTVKRLWRDPYHEISMHALDRIAIALQIPAGELIEQVPDPPSAK